jgi:hypothetical protein
MATEIPFAVTNWLAWAPGLVGRSAWLSWAKTGAPAPAEIDETPPALPMTLRRRAGAFGQKVIATALGGGRADTAHYVFASRHGELSRTVSILDDIVRGQTPSPTEFSLSVHHAIAGLLSIHTGNRSGHTAIAAGVDTFGFGFMEAAVYAAEHAETPVLLVYHDAPMPEPYQPLTAADSSVLPLVVVLQFEAARGGAASGSFTATPCERAGTGLAVTSAPCDFLRFLLSGAAAVKSMGELMDWGWQRAA